MLRRQYHYGHVFSRQVDLAYDSYGISIIIHLSCFMLSFYLTSHSFLPDLFPYIRLDCISLCTTQFSPQFHTTKTEVSIRCFLYVLFIVWHVPSHDCSRYIQIYEFHATKTELQLFKVQPLLFWFLAQQLVHTLNQWLGVCLHFLQVTCLYIDQGRNEKKKKIDKNK